jgi:GNAT superfamily N-acetyltransferase
MTICEGADMAPGGAVRVRLCRAADRDALLRLGHPAGVPPVLAPPIGLRLRWFLGGTLAAGFVAESGPDGGLVGSIHFVRDRRDPGTWMFGHWRVLPAHRRSGIGRRLLREGMVRLPGMNRLYSYVDWGNDGSIRAHDRLGFEAAPELQGMAPLASLAALGPPTPAVRLRAVDRRDPEAARLYARALGDLWMRLVPALAIPATLGGRLFIAEDGGLPVGLVRLRRGDAWVFAAPEACDGALLSRLAARIRDLGLPLDAEVALRGLSRSLVSRGGPIAVQILMGMSDVRRLR